MRVDYRVSGTSHDDLKAKAAEIAKRYAGDLDHTLTVGHISGEYRFGKDREQGLNDGPAPKFFASCYVDVQDPDPVMADNRPDGERDRW